MTFLVHLLGHPGREFHALDLVALFGGSGAEWASLGCCAVSSTGARAAGDLTVARYGEGLAILDARAKLAYRDRVTELRQEVHDATACHDPERAARAEAELEFCQRELARSLGLGGRGRLVGSVPERARLNVTRSIGRALARISVHHPVLGNYLRRTVKTGTFCCYAPDAQRMISWTL
jgi:hypothetical protein